MLVRRTFAALVAAPCLLSACLLSACGGGSSSVADPPVSSSPTSPVTTQPPRHESPQHFIRRWADAEKRMENTGITDAYLAISHGCRACRQLADDIGRFYANGGYSEWGGWQIHSITREDSKGSTLVFSVKVNSLPTTYQEAADGPIKHLQGGPATHQLTLRSVGRSWLMIQKAQLAG